MPNLSGIVSCDSVAIRLRIRIVRCEWPAKRQKHKPCESPFFLPLLPHCSQRSVLKVPKQGQFHAAIRVTNSHCDSCAKVHCGDGRYRGENFEMRNRQRSATAKYATKCLTWEKNFKVLKSWAWLPKFCRTLKRHTGFRSLYGDPSLLFGLAGHLACRCWSRRYRQR